MVVAVITVRVMQVTVDKIIDVVTMRYGLVTATGTMDMIRIVTTTLVRWRAAIRIGLAHFDLVFDNGSVLGHVMQMSVVQVVDVVTVLDASVLAIWSMLVFVVFVDVSHRLFSVMESWELRFFHRMHDPVGHQTRNVSVSQAVKNVLTLASGANVPFALEHP